MATGLITVTKDSTQVIGSNSNFTTELASGGFIVFTAGGTDYTMCIASIQSNTELTLVSNYRGSTTSGLGFDFIPQKAMAQVTAAIVARNAEALTGFILDKQNWQKVFSSDNDIEVILPDGSKFNGPSWKSLSNKLAGFDNVAIPNLREQWYRTLSDVGIDLVSGSFEEGATVTKTTDAVWSKSLGQCFVWAGPFPKTIDANSTPANSGGESPTAWSSVHGATMRTSVVKKGIQIAFGSFVAGGTARSKITALYNPADGMYYTPRSGTQTATPNSSPNSAWVCCGIMDQYDLGDPRNFKAVGDGTADDTIPLRLAYLYASLVQGVALITAGCTYSADKTQLLNTGNLTIAGKGCIKFKAGRTGSFLYADGAQLTFAGACPNVRIIGPEWDGNRAASPSYTGFAHGVQFVTGVEDFRSNNGGPNKATKNIYIADCYFHDHGSYRAGNDKFGDAIYLFGVDGVLIENNTFKDVGRWAVAASDIFNLTVINNNYDASKAGTIALGFCDVENESIDNVNGSYSRNIVIANNNLYGYGQILVGAGCNSENEAGAYHYLKNVLVTGNNLVVAGGAHAIADYLTNLILIGCAPFATVKPTGGRVENVNMVFSNNNVRCEISSLAIGMGINAQRSLQANNAPVDVSNNLISQISFTGNTIYGPARAIQASGNIEANGYTFHDIIIDSNSGVVTGSNSIGIRLAAFQLSGYKVSNNVMEGSTVRSISLEDGRDVGATQTYGEAVNNNCYGSAGTNMFAYLSRGSFIGNSTRGTTSCDLTVSVVDKDYGNTWNQVTKSLAAFTVNDNGGQQAFGGLTLVSHMRFGYQVTVANPYSMGQCVISSNMQSQGVGIVIINNHMAAGSGAFSGAAADWLLTVEKR